MTASEVQAPRGPGAPSKWVARFAPPATEASGFSGDFAGKALDLACGRGRHAHLLLNLGYSVTAVDRDVSGLEDIADHPNLEIIQADLEAASGGWSLEQRRFALVVVTNYLWRPLLPQIVAAVAPGGCLIYETFAQGNERFGRPANPAYLLQPGELEAAIAGQLTVVAYEQCEVQAPRPAMVQRICARRDS